MNNEAAESVDDGIETAFSGSEEIVCWVCCEDSKSSSKEDLLIPMGCACRGSSGLAHLSCLVQVATHNVDGWTTCPTCHQDFTGECEVGLARARWEGVKDRPPEDEERLFVANNLAVTLQESTNDTEGAHKLLKEVLTVRRRTLGDEHQDTLDSITNMALLYSEMGDYTAALVLSKEALTTTRRIFGTEHEEAGHAIISLAAVHALMGNYEEALPLHEEALAIRQRLLGPDHLDTMNSMSKVGQCLICLGEDEKGRGLLEQTIATARRVLGTAHPSFKHFESCQDV